MANLSPDQSGVNVKLLINKIFAAIVPLLVLLAATAVACILGYIAVLVWGDGVSLRGLIKKITQALLVLSIFPAMRYLKLTKADLGLADWPVLLKQVCVGFALGFITLLPVLGLLYWLGVDVIDTAKPWTAAWLGKTLILELLLALLVACFEEPVFRGILLAGLNKKITAETAILISAIYYALLHFLTTKTEIPIQDITVLSGFSLAAEAFGNLAKPENFTALLSLCAVGIFLGLLRTRLKTSLGFCIGCHACWVWQIKLGKSLCDINPHSDYLYLVSRYDGVIGPLVTFWLVAAILIYLGIKWAMMRHDVKQ